MTKPTFSEREGLEPLEKVLQLKSMNKRLRNGLWNCLLEFDKIFRRFLYSLGDVDEDIDATCNIIHDHIVRNIWNDFFGNRLDELENELHFPEYFSKEYYSFDWNQVYDFIEFILDLLVLYEYNDVIQILSKRIDSVLKRENSAYKLLNNQFARIDSDEEREEIQEAIDGTDKSVSEHLKKAIKLFSDRESPDYHNSIKESISAVESMCWIITKEKSKTLSKALKKMENDRIIDLHQALKEGFDKIYGWTSDEGGIRHGFGFGEGKDVAFEDAKFMLVAASAFVNYLKEKAIKAGVDV